MELRAYQITLTRAVRFEGTGVHSGDVARLVCHPAQPNSGILFRRRRADGSAVVIAAQRRFVGQTELCTCLSADGLSVTTIEHLMAAITGLGIDNMIIDVDGEEVPILDGSALPFVEAFEAAGFVSQAAQRRFIRVLRPVEIRHGKSLARFEPASEFGIDVEIDFPSPLIGRQRYVASLSPSRFAGELAAARTFGFMADVKRLRDAGYARGAGLHNTLVVDGDQVLNEDGLRFSDEFVRHKALDAVGDVALAGLPILGMFHSYRGGHAVNAAAVEALLSSPEAYRIETAPRTARPLVEASGTRPAQAVGSPAMH